MKSKHPFVERFFKNDYITKRFGNEICIAE